MIYATAEDGVRVPISIALQKQSGDYQLAAVFTFEGNVVQHDAVALRIVPPTPACTPVTPLTLYDTKGLSAAHLNRLFQAEVGTTFARHVLRVRMERVWYLLTHTTLAIKAIAAQVGIPNLQVFNKIVKRELGAPPRAIRTEKRRQPTLWKG